jgi:DNA-binding NarL/FixJ family response regulator
MNTESSSRQGRPFGGSASDQMPVDRNGSTPPVDVVLATHDDSLRSELAGRLARHGGFVVAAEKTNATQALGATLFHSPRVCLLGVDLPGELESRIRSIRAERPETRIGILASSADQPGLLRAVLAGAGGVLLTSDPPETFMAELSALARGERVLPPEGSEGTIDDGAPTDSAPADTVEPMDGTELDSSTPTDGTPALAAEAPRDSWLKATVLYLPRFFHHLRRRLRAHMPLPIAWSSARERMWDYR